MFVHVALIILRDAVLGNLAPCVKCAPYRPDRPVSPRNVDVTRWQVGTLARPGTRGRAVVESPDLSGCKEDHRGPGGNALAVEQE